ncbi:MAG: hypothetical protein ACR5LG_15835 [Sodalis sp. (in: enterobacteria)]|uniref:hypothetical protein n=1 Tax=Sodalis sp. (in: enterobacteria) TaxID=1898979 RepID=UPI003F3DDE96
MTVTTPSACRAINSCWAANGHLPGLSGVAATGRVVIRTGAQYVDEANDLKASG